MINDIYTLPTYAEIDGVQYAIRDGGDWRIAVRCIVAFNDVSMTIDEKWNCAFVIFYEDYDKITNYDEACKFIDWFINGGFYSDSKKPEEDKENNSYFDVDMPMMVETVNIKLGKDIRGDKLHWWTFLGYTRQCEPTGQFSTVLTIRDKKKHGEKLTKQEMEFERNNYDLINPKSTLTDVEKDWLYGEW